MMTHYKSLDIVALLIDLANYGLVKGQVGTIVEVFADDIFEVEFADKKGVTLATVSIEANDLMLLHFETVNTK